MPERKKKWRRKRRGKEEKETEKGSIGEKKRKRWNKEKRGN